MAFGRLFCHCSEDSLLNIGWQSGIEFTWGLRFSLLLCLLKFLPSPLWMIERQPPGKEFVGNTAQCILIAGRDGMTFPLFRSHVGKRASNIEARRISRL